MNTHNPLDRSGEELRFRVALATASFVDDGGKQEVVTDADLVRAVRAQSDQPKNISSHVAEPHE